MKEKNMSLRLSKELHRKLKIQLAKDSLSFQKWATDRIKEYVEEGQE